MEMMINYNLILAKNQYLSTERLLLRPVTLNDAEDMFEYASDEETATYVFPVHYRIEDTEASIAGYFIKDPLGKYGIELKENGKMIGSIDLRVDEINRIAEIGYTLNKAYWGRGIVAEAGQALIQLGFEKLNLVRVYAKYDIDNPNSGKVMDKLGMKEEGIIPNARISKGKIATDVIKGITVRDWEDMNKQ
ncbi:GNAT family N-acetyltransferase [Enterococcus larvae]|uniref:GNAT family N-acetyltransferase n=1 Tax=Enterococcus larvae TaxID=2794352 RepID=UPI003F2A13FB